MVRTIVLLWVFVASSCNLAKKLPENDYLLHKNEVEIREDCNVSASDLEAILKQKPNRKIGGFLRFHLYMYNLGSNLKESSSLRNWLTNIVGEEPVILDSTLVLKSSKQIGIYLKNKGYFNNSVRDSVVLKPKRKKAINHFIVYPGKPYIVGQVTISMMDDELLPYMQAVDKIKDNKPQLRKGDIFDVDVLDTERDRISSEMQNLGFYYFQKEHISYQVDTNLGGKKIKIKQIIKNPTLNINDSLHILKHQQYKIDEIWVKGNKSLEFDSEYTNKIIAIGNYKFKSELLYKNIFINNGDYYNVDQIGLTYNRLLALKVFRRIDISFTPNILQSDSNLLNCSIMLTPMQKHSFSLETNGTTRSGNLGLNGNITYRNRNLFHGAEIFEFKSKVGFEAQKTGAGDIDVSSEESPSNNLDKIFNTFEYGFESTVTIPSILNPFKALKSNLLKPKTNFSLIYNYQTRPSYTRNILNFQYRYSWSLSNTNRFSLSPLDISTIKINLDSSAKAWLSQFNNPFLINSYQDHLILAARLGYTFSNQRIKRLGNHVYFNASVESAGNSLRLINQSLSSPQNEDGSYDIFGIQYAHYVKTDFDLRLYYRINKFSNMAYRLFTGIGVPLTNFKVLPFEKSFFAGGANGIRAWQARTLGPGSYTDPEATTIDKIGDFQLEGNVEYRFKILKLLEGAIFIDAGNIWVLKDREEDKRDGAIFNLNTFYTQFGIGSGLGLRLDLSFFLIRLDWGVKVYDPALSSDEEWFYQPKDNYKITFGKDKYEFSTFNLGIGYPF